MCKVGDRPSGYWVGAPGQFWTEIQTTHHITIPCSPKLYGLILQSSENQGQLLAHHLKCNN